MTIFKEGNTWANRGGRKKSILEIDFENGLVIYAFPGSLSPNDLLIRFKDANIPKTQIRQPKHIHWAVDMLIKKENNEQLSNAFLKDMLNRWENIPPLQNREFQTIIDHLELSQNHDFINKYSALNEHGFFSMVFLITLMEILMLQEKTNYPDAYMFKDVVKKIMDSKDLYAIISKATHTGN
jgi:hypothetical protein